LQPAPQIDFTKTVESLPERGLSISQIRDLGFPVQRDDLQAAYRRGCAIGVLNVATRLYQEALAAGSTRAQQLYLQARGGPEWRPDADLPSVDQPLNLMQLQKYSRTRLKTRLTENTSE
jgi:hypothetical protein